MLLIYVALIGSAGWLLATTPQGFIPAQDRGYVIISAQLPGAASLARTTEIVRQIEKIALDTPGIVRVAVFAGLSGATRTQASNAAALFPVFEEPEVRLKKGLSAAVDHRRSAQAAFGARGRFHHRHSAALDSRHRHRRRLHHAHPGSPGPRSRIAGGGNRRTGRRGAQGAWAHLGVFAVHRQYAAGVRRYRSHQGGEARRADPERDGCDRDLFRFDLCQRLQYSRPHLSRHRAGRSAVPEGDRRSRPAAHPQCRRRHGDARQRRELQRHLRTGSRRALQSLSGIRTAGRHAAGDQFGDRDRRP